MVIGDIFTNAARAVPDRPAAVLGETRVTFGELARRGEHAANVLDDLGVRAGDRVVCRTRTTLDVLPAFVGLAHLGAVFVPLAPGLLPAEAARTATAARPGLLITDGTGDAEDTALARTLGVPRYRLDHPPDATPGGRGPRPRPLESDPHVLFFTSGSTGRPKGVVLSHRVNVLRTHPGSQLEPRGAMVCPYPLFHMGAWTIALQQWQARDTLVLVERPDGPAIVDAVRRHAATRLNCVPAVWRRVLDHLAAESAASGTPATLDTLRFADSGTSATPPELLDAIAAAAPHAVPRVFYGSTEAGNVTSLDGDDVFRKPGSCGVPSPFQRVEIAEDGEVLVSGPLLFDGYFDDEAATAAALPDGVFHTGDLGALDDDGYLRITGRVGDLVRTGGEAVAPTEIEAVLAHAPGVREVAVVGLPDAAWGEVLCAVVVPHSPGEPPDLAALRAYCAGRLATHKHPRRVVYAEELPRTAATGQVLRRVLVARIIAAG